MSASATAEDQQPRQQQDGDELSPVQRDQALNTVLTYTFLKVMMDCSTISVWPLLLKDLYAGDVALAAAAAATTSSICGLVELVVTPAVGKLSDRFGRRLFSPFRRDCRPAVCLVRYYKMCLAPRESAFR